MNAAAILLWCLVAVTFGLLARIYLRGERGEWEGERVAAAWVAALFVLGAAIITVARGGCCG